MKDDCYLRRMKERAKKRGLSHETPPPPRRTSQVPVLTVISPSLLLQNLRLISNILLFQIMLYRYFVYRPFCTWVNFFVKSNLWSRHSGSNNISFTWKARIIIYVFLKSRKYRKRKATCWVLKRVSTGSPPIGILFVFSSTSVKSSYPNVCHLVSHIMIVS